MGLRPVALVRAQGSGSQAYREGSLRAARPFVVSGVVLAHRVGIGGGIGPGSLLAVDSAMNMSRLILATGGGLLRLFGRLRRSTRSTA